MLDLVNRARGAAGGAPLAPNPALRALARQYGQEMFAHAYLSHRSLDGRDPWDRMAAAGIRFRYAGENLAYAADVQTANTLLINSPEHRRNILSTEYHRVGIGVLDGAGHGVIVVEEFTN